MPDHLEPPNSHTHDSRDDWPPMSWDEFEREFLLGNDEDDRRSAN